MTRTSRRKITQQNKYIVYGDIGGTKSLLQMAEYKRGAIKIYDQHRYHSNDYACFSDMLGDFLKHADATESHNTPETACFAVAGPVSGQCARLTNLPWQINAAEIANFFSISSVKLLNDFEAAATAIDILTPDDLVALQIGHAQPQAMRVVLGAGTGMGVAWLVWQNGAYRPLSTEAGHIDFAPTSALQIQLLESLQKKYRHISVERLLSGAGLTYIFKFLHEHLAEFSNLIPIQLDEDNGAVVTTLAIEQNHPVAIRALELFSEIYGAYAGNLALAGLCRNGVFIAGGIAPKIIDTLRAGSFMRAFCDKGRFSDLMTDIPVYVVTNPEIGLLGAKKHAWELLCSKIDNNEPLSV